MTEFTNRTSELSPSQDGHTITSVTSFGEDARGELYIISQPFSANAGAIFKVISTAPKTPENDLCENALAIGDGVTNFTNAGASTDGPDEPDACSFFGDSNIQNDVWFAYTATCTGDLTLDLCDSDYAAKIGVYGATCPAGPGEILACNAAACGTRAQLTLPVTQGQTYLLRVGGHNGATGDGVLDISCEPGASCTGDLNSDNVVDVSDLLTLLSSWGPCPGCDADLNDDDVVDVSDLLSLLSAWGPCAESPRSRVSR